jgi:hypothetical protein
MNNLISAVFSTVLLAANDTQFTEFGTVLSDLFDSMFTPLIAIAVSLCAIWGCYLGFKFWRSGGDENKRKEAKNAVASFVIGVVVIFVVAVAAPLLITALQEWMKNYQ